MDLRQLRYVVAVVDEGGFTRAADELGVAQPSLSQGVRALEAELGVELFHRTPRGVVLTDAGAALLGPARQALRDAETARAAVASVTGLRSGRLDLVCLPTLAAEPAATLIGTFRRAHPGVTVRLVEPEDVAAVADRLRDGSSEVGLTEVPVGGEDLEVHDLGEQRYVALVPEALDRSLRGGARLSLAALDGRPVVTTPPGTSTRRQLDEALAGAGAVPEIAVETDHREAIAPLVAAGAGIALVPRELAQRAAGPGIVVREPSPAVVRRIGLVHRRGPLSPAAHAFVAAALDADRPGARGRPRPRRRTPPRGSEGS